MVSNCFRNSYFSWWDNRDLLERIDRMKVILLVAVTLLSLLNILIVVVSDSERVYKELNKKQIHRLSILKDIGSAIVIISLALLAFV